MLVALRHPAMLDGAAPRRNRPAWPPADGTRIQLHLGTAQVPAVIGRRGREAADLPDGRVTAILRLETSVATFCGDQGIARRPSPGNVVAGVEVMDPLPARGVSRRRATPERLAALAVAVTDRDPDAAGHALVALHGLLDAGRLGAVVGALASADIDAAAPGSAPILAPDIVGALEEVAIGSGPAVSRRPPHGVRNPPGRPPRRAEEGTPPPGRCPRDERAGARRRGQRRPRRSRRPTATRPRRGPGPGSIA